MESVVISGNIESVTYTMNITDNGKKVNGIWTGSSDGSVDNLGAGRRKRSEQSWFNIQ